jgi:hypothetical protein
MEIEPHATAVARHDRIRIARRSFAVIGVLIQATWIVAGCGSTSPIAPSTPTAVEYPSIVGTWLEDTSALMFRARGSTDWRLGYGCDAWLTVEQQNGGMFSGRALIEGISLSSDKNCWINLTFTGQVTRDGTITAMSATTGYSDGNFHSHDCQPVSSLAFLSGTVSATAMEIRLTDHAMCRLDGGLESAPYNLDVDRMLIISLRPASRSAPSVARRVR